MIGTIIDVLSSWEVQAVIVALMIFMPIIFYLASAPVPEKKRNDVKFKPKKEPQEVEK